MGIHTTTPCHSRETHKANLTRLFEDGRIKVISAETVKNFCPHLKDKQISSLMKQASQQRVCFATPAILLKHSYHVLSLSTAEEKVESSLDVNQTRRVMYLEYVSPQRTKESYANNKAHEGSFSNHQFSKEAMKYSETHWSKSLILDTWASYGEVLWQEYLKRSECDHEDTPRTRAAIYWTTKLAWNEIVNANLEPNTKLWNDSLGPFSLNPIEGQELQGNGAIATKIEYDLHERQFHSNTSNRVLSGEFFQRDGARDLPEAFVLVLQSLGSSDGMANAPEKISSAS